MLPNKLQQIVLATAADPQSAHPLVDEIDIGSFTIEQVVSAAINSKECAFGRGGIEVAEKLLLRLLDKYPQHGVALYETAVVYRYKLDSSKAVFYAEKAYQVDKNDSRTQLLFMHMLISNGRFIEAQKVFERHYNTGGSDPELLAMRDFASYYQNFPLGYAQELDKDLRRNHYWMTATEVVAAAKESIRERRPYALIRLGDGEGAFAKVSDTDEKAYEHLYSQFRAHWVRYHNGDAFDPIFTGYNDLTSRLMDVSLEADALGIPYMGWISHEYSLCADRTIPCLLNINRYLADWNKVKIIRLCDQDVHLQLHRLDAYSEIFADVRSATVLSCLVGVDRKIAERFSIDNVDLILVPRESYAPHIDNQDLRGINKHFPSFFWNTIDLLSQEHHGRVFIVAAGTYGKYYCAVIKRHGGIALDIGSIVDGWMNLVSRPFYEQEFGIKKNVEDIVKGYL